jgi:hypothetical protein
MNETARADWKCVLLNAEGDAEGDSILNNKP